MTARTRSTAETSVREVEDWRFRADCKDDGDAFDLDVIGKQPAAILAAAARCRACPVLEQCTRWTDSLPAAEKPRDLVQAGRVYTSSDSIRASVTGRCHHGRDRSVAACALCEHERKRNREIVAQRRARNIEPDDPRVTARRRAVLAAATKPTPKRVTQTMKEAS